MFTVLPLGSRVSSYQSWWQQTTNCPCPPRLASLSTLRYKHTMPPTITLPFTIMSLILVIVGLSSLAYTVAVFVESKCCVYFYLLVIKFVPSHLSPYLISVCLQNCLPLQVICRIVRLAAFDYWRQKPLIVPRCLLKSKQTEHPWTVEA